MHGIQTEKQFQYNFFIAIIEPKILILFVIIYFAFLMTTFYSFGIHLILKLQLVVNYIVKLVSLVHTQRIVNQVSKEYFKRTVREWCNIFQKPTQFIILVNLN